MIRSSSIATKSRPKHENLQNSAETIVGTSRKRGYDKVATAAAVAKAQAKAFTKDDNLQYYCASKMEWVGAAVKKIHSDGRIDDLDVKKGVKPDQGAGRTRQGREPEGAGGGGGGGQEGGRRQGRRSLGRGQGRRQDGQAGRPINASMSLAASEQVPSFRHGVTRASRGSPISLRVPGVPTKMGACGELHARRLSWYRADRRISIELRNAELPALAIIRAAQLWIPCPSRVLQNHPTKVIFILRITLPRISPG